MIITQLIFGKNKVLSLVKKYRIDVVYNYDHNAVDFWEKQGFIPCEKIKLEWNGYKTNAIKMLKFI